MAKRFTKEQKEAIRQYWLKIASQDNYLASVFVNEGSTGYHARLVAEAAAKCEQLGVPQVNVPVFV